MKKILILILAFTILPIIVNAKNQSFDEFWKNIQKIKDDKTQLALHCEDFLKDGDFKITKEEFLNNNASDALVKWITILTKNNKYSAKAKKDKSFASVKYYKYGAGTNFENESNFYVLRIDGMVDGAFTEICFALRGGMFKIVGFTNGKL